MARTERRAAECCSSAPCKSAVWPYVQWLRFSGRSIVPGRPPSHSRRDVMPHTRFPNTFCRIAAAAVLAAACGGTTIDSPQSFGAVVTVVDSGPALRRASTFVLPDTVIRLAERGSAIDPTIAHQLVIQVRAHLRAMGWVEIADARESRPDVVVLLAASTQIQTGLAYGDWYSSWGYLPYWGTSVDPSWAWGYPGGAVPYSYQSGTLLVAMLDVGAPRDLTTKTIPLLWAAGLDGLVGDGSTMTRIRAGLDQAFAQSPYLRLN